MTISFFHGTCILKGSVFRCHVSGNTVSFHSSEVKIHDSMYMFFLVAWSMTGNLTEFDKRLMTKSRKYPEIDMKHNYPGPLPDHFQISPTQILIGSNHCMITPWKSNPAHTHTHVCVFFFEWGGGVYKFGLWISQ